MGTTHNKEYNTTIDISLI